jgi:hypothetical protein
MRSKFSSVFLVGLCFVLAVTVVTAEEWQRVGQRVVDFRNNPEVITVVGNTGTFAKLKLQVKESSLEIAGLKVYLADAGTFDVTLNKYLGPGGETKVIEIPDGPKAIQKVEFTYKTTAEGARMPLVRLLASN